eukprot:sb/3464592/
MAYAKRLNPQSGNHFIKVDFPKGSVDDATEALAGECEDRGVKLQRDFNTILKEHAPQLSLDDSVSSWTKRDALSADMAGWMSRRNDLYCKVEGVLQEAGVPVPSLIYSSRIEPPSTTGSGDIGTSDKSAVSLVLGKLNILVSSYMLERSLNTTQHESPLKPIAPKPEKEALKILDDTVNDIMREENVMYETPPPSVDLVITDEGARAVSPPPRTNPVSPPPRNNAISPPPRSQAKSPLPADPNDDADQEVLDLCSGGDWESEGEWETEEEITAASTPPPFLELGGDDGPPPVPPPRTLLSPMQNASRRATSLKTKDKSSDPRIEDLRKVTRAASSVHPKSKPDAVPTIRNATTTPNVAAGTSATLPPNLSPHPYEGMSSSSSRSSSSSSSSSSSEEERRKKHFSRSRSARFTRTRVTAPGRNAASFRGKKSRSNAPPPSEPLEFFNKFADLN